jgi:radical SAM superfamily enzyme YgiQ (UPF0313 family)
MLPKEFTNYYKLPKIYANSNLFISPPDQYVPPAERKPHVLALELTSGCDYNKCLFCDAPKISDFYERSLIDFNLHVKNIFEEIGDFKHRIKRVFIGRNNALAVNHDKLIKALRIIKNNVSWKNERISIYGRTDTIRSRRAKNIRELKREGLGMIYWGVESGCDEVLKYVNKGATLDKHMDAGYVAKTADIDLSVMIMVGLGGIKHYESHTKKTIEFINEIQPEYVTFLGTNPDFATRYAKKVDADAGNRHLNKREIVTQARSILRGIKPYNGQFGMFDDNIDSIGISPACFNVTLDNQGKREALVSLRQYLSNTKYRI